MCALSALGMPPRLLLVRLAAAVRPVAAVRCCCRSDRLKFLGIIEYRFRSAMFAKKGVAPDGMVCF